MSAVRLGKMVLRWCETCNVPILSQKTCSICENKTHAVNHTPPGDIRPAFTFDIDLIKGIIDDQFGEGCGDLFMPKNGVIILNHAPDLDKLDEIIFNGQVQGALQFDLIKKQFKFLPRLNGANRFLRKIQKGYVKVDDGAVGPISSGSNALIPGIIMMSVSIVPGDEVVVMSQNDEIIGLGSAQISKQELVSQTRGVGVKIRWHKKNTKSIEMNECSSQEINKYRGIDKEIISDMKNNPGYIKKDWKLTIQANRNELDVMIEKAKEFILSTTQQFQLPVAVSFSGGKDSLATLLLVLETSIKPELLFIDTGLEFPETLENVKNISKKFSLTLKIGKPINTFWEGLEYFGPPGKDYRWCCKTCKLGPTTRLIKTHYPEGILAFIGQRRYESEQRSRKGMIWKNPWVPGQIGASPIQHWSALHIWLYIFDKEIEFNELYSSGLERIGCWLCPASDLADFEMVSQQHPDYNRWMEFLNKYSKAHLYTKFWIKYGAWRWKKLPKGVEQLMRNNEISLRHSDKDIINENKSKDEIANQGESITMDGNEKGDIDSTGGLQLYLADGFTDCKYGLSLEGVFNNELEIARVANLANVLGNVQFNDTEGYCTIDEKIDIFREGGIVVKGKSEHEIKKQITKIKNIVLRALECISCGVCIGRCENDALDIDASDHLKRIMVIEDKCTHCGKCLGPCPVVNFKTVDVI